MDLLVKQRRVRPSGQSKEKQEEFIGTGVRTPLRLSQQTDSFNEDNAEQGLYQRRLSGQVSEDNDSGDTEFAAAVAAVAFAIHSLEEDELEIQKKRREDLETSRNKIKSRKDDSSSAGRATRIFSNTEMKSAVSLNKSIGQEREAQERAFPTPNPSHTSSMRPTPSADRNQNQMRDSSRRNDVEAKADAWEKAEMTKIKKRYENMNSKILAWEDEKKTQAKFNMEKNKGELEQRSALNLRHYQEKIARIDQIAGGARQQLEEKRRNQVSKVEEKANTIRSTDKVSVKCFCFYCH
ncbi:hypothetical protein ACJW31_04G102600 [Castanea mollissima]